MPQVFSALGRRLGCMERNGAMLLQGGWPPVAALVTAFGGALRRVFEGRVVAARC